MRAEFVEAVLDLAALIPPKAVLSYGDIAFLLDSGGPRQVGTVLARYGSSVPWWRVIQSTGKPPECHEGTALQQYRHEGTPLRGRTTGQGSSWRVDMAAARWKPDDAEWAAVESIRAALVQGPMSDPDDRMDP